MFRLSPLNSTVLRQHCVVRLYFRSPNCTLHSVPVFTNWTDPTYVEEVGVAIGNVIVNIANP